MADPDLIARLYPFQNCPWATRAITKLNIPRYDGPPPSAPPASVGRHVRGATEQPEVVPIPYLELRFRDRPRTSLGFVLGKDPSSNIVLVNEKGISGRHCAIRFEN